MINIIFNNSKVNVNFIDGSIHITFKIKNYINNLITFELINCELVDYCYFTINFEKNKLVIFKGGCFVDDSNTIFNNINSNQLGILNYEDLYNNKYINYKDSMIFILNKDDVTIILNCKELNLPILLEEYKKNIYLYRKTDKLELIDTYIEFGGIYSPQDLLFDSKED